MISSGGCSWISGLVISWCGCFQIMSLVNYESLFLECERVSSRFQHFTAIRELSVKICDSLVMTEEMLDSALARQCSEFVPGVYSKLQVHTTYLHRYTASILIIDWQDAYEMLGKTQTASDQLLMHYTTATHNICWQVSDTWFWLVYSKWYLILIGRH